MADGKAQPDRTMKRYGQLRRHTPPHLPHGDGRREGPAGPQPLRRPVAKNLARVCRAAPHAHERTHARSLARHTHTSLARAAPPSYHNTPSSELGLGCRDSDGRDSDGRDSDGRDSDGRDSDGRDSDGRDSDDSDGLDSDGRDSDGRNSDGRNSDACDLDGRDSDGRDSDGRDSDGRDSDGRDSDGRDSDARALCRR